MAGKPIATVGSMHVCPMCNGTVPHVGGPVSGPGSPNVLVNGKPVALMGDMCVCSGPPDTIVQGEPTVLVNGVPVATVGSMTAHGGQIIQGEPTVIIGSAKPSSPTIAPINEIPFPEISPVQVVVSKVSGFLKGNNAAQSILEAKQNTSQLKKESKKHGYMLSIDFSL